jgi:uncharacterized membrane protein (UPF0127 family)
MRVIVASVFLAVIATACSTADSGDPTAPTTTTHVPTATAAEETPEIPPQLEELEIRTVTVGIRDLLLAIADSPGLRATGLMHVEDLGMLDGMLFFWRHEAAGGFWMKDTVIPLDIVWFDEFGVFVGRASMVPCTETACPKYQPGLGIDFRYAIEAGIGDLDWVTEATRIVYED